MLTEGDSITKKRQPSRQRPQVFVPMIVVRLNSCNDPLLEGLLILLVLLVILVVSHSCRKLPGRSPETFVGVDQVHESRVPR